MGVVYKARQASLNRIVALKMILAGQLASGREVERFYTEAQAAANLQHSNIVAIHEVGQHSGQHYFSMDYVDGKSLAQLVREKPITASQAARYVKTIAEAIEYDHLDQSPVPEQGIVFIALGGLYRCAGQAPSATTTTGKSSPGWLPTTAGTVQQFSSRE